VKKQSLNCGSCLYLNKERVYERRCSELGKLVSAKACGSYKPDPHLLIGETESIDRLGLISKAISGLTPNAVQSLASILHAEKLTRKYGWRFYQKVYVRYTGQSSADQYMDNFTVGHVLYADKERVYICGNSGKMMLSVINERNTCTVYSIARFRELQAELLRTKRITAPELKRATLTIKPLDAVLESDEPLDRKLVKSKTRMDDLVSIISKLSQGYDIKKTKRTTKARTHVVSRGGSTELTLDWNP